MIDTQPDFSPDGGRLEGRDTNTNESLNFDQSLVPSVDEENSITFDDSIIPIDELSVSSIHASLTSLHSMYAG